MSSVRSGSVAQSLSFLRILEGDLKVIVSETKKKAPEVREAADRALQKLREVDVSAEGSSGEEWGAEALASALSDAEEITFALCSACDPSLPKVSLRAVGCLHKLVTHSGVAPERLNDVLAALQRLLDTKDEDGVLLKVLEALLSLLTSRRYRIALDEETCSAGLTLLLRLGLLSQTRGGAAIPPSSPLAVLTQAAEVAFRQVASEMFIVAGESLDGVEAPKAPADSAVHVSNSAPKDLPQGSRSVYLLFRDLCALVGGDECTWLGVKKIRLGLALEVLEEALRGNLFVKSALMRTLLTSRLCPVLHERLCSSGDAQTYLLLLRIVFLLVVNFTNELQEDIEVLLVLLCRTVEKPSSAGEDSTKEHQLLALEALRSILHHNDGELIQRLDSIFDARSNTTGVVKAAIEVTSKVAQGKRMGVSSTTVSFLVGKVTPLSNSFLRTMATLANSAMLVPAYGACLSSLNGLAAVAQTDELCADLLKTTYKTLFSVIVPFLEGIDSCNKSAPVAISAIVGMLASISRLGTIPELEEAAEGSIVALSTAGRRYLKHSDPKVVFPVYEALFRASLHITPSLNKLWLSVIDAVEQLEDHATLASELKEPLEAFFSSAVELDVSLRQNLLSALVSVSRMKAGKKINCDDRMHTMWRIQSYTQAWLEKKEGKGIDGGTWELVTGHFVSIGKDDEDRRVRETAVKVIEQLASSALGSVDNHILPHAKVLAPIRDLFASPYRDTRLGALVAVRKLLETRGELLRGEGAWRHVVVVLRLTVDGGFDDGGDDSHTSGSSVTETPVQIGFRALQLVASDFLPVVAFSVVGTFVEALGLYGGQKNDVNSALTSVSLLWGVADFVAKVDTEQDKDSLWLTLFEQSKILGLDERPEVRNGAIKSLMGTLMAHGAKLCDRTWHGCISLCLTPLLDGVMEGGQAVTAAAAAAAAAVPDSKGSRGDKSASGGGGSGGGGDEDNGVRLFLHHSRDTPQKQWNETRMLVLTGMGRLFRRFTASLMDLNVFESAWRSVLGAASVAATGDGAAKEITMAGVATMLEFVTISGGLEDGRNEEVRRLLWTSSWDCIDGAVWTAGEPDRKVVVNEAALVQLLEGLTTLASALSARLATSDSLRLVSILTRIVLMENPELSTASSMTVEQVALNALTSLQFRKDDTETWTSLMKQMLRLLFATKNDDSDGFVKHNVMEAVQTMYTSNNLPTRVKVFELEDVLSTLLPIMATQMQFVEEAVAAAKNSVPSIDTETRARKPERGHRTSTSDESATEPIWASAVKTFIVAVAHGCDENQTYRANVWPVAVQGFEQFLFPKSSKVVGGLRTPNTRGVPLVSDFEDGQKSMHAKVNRLVQKQDALMVEAVLLMLQRSEGAEEEVKRKMLRILAKGAVDGQRRSHFARACQAGLFQLAGQNSRAGQSEKMMVALKAEAGLTTVCEGVLGAYVRDGRRSGKCPLPAARRAEVLFLLKKLRDLRVSTESGARGGQKSHLLNLYPTICECIECDDDDVRTLTRELLVDAGGALGLRYDSSQPLPFHHAAQTS